MKKRLIAVLTLLVCYCAHADTILKVEYLDGNEAKEQLSRLSKIVFDSSGQIKFDYKSGNIKDFGSVSNTNKIVFVEGDLTSVKSLSAGVTLKVYPNPTAESVSISGVEQGQMVSVYSSAGQLLLRTTETDINVSNFADGQYFIVVGGNVVKLIKK